MRRREFLEIILAGSGPSWFPKRIGSGFLDETKGDTSRLPDLPLHAREAMGFLERAIDEHAGIVLPYFRITFTDKPGFLDHEHWDWSENLGRWLYGRIFARRILNDTSNLEFEQRIAEQICRTMGPDGLHYYPDTIACGNERPTGVAILWDNRSVFMGLTQFWSLTGDPETGRRLKRMFDTLDRHAVRGPRRGQAYYAVDEIPRGYQPKEVVDFTVGQNTGGFILPFLDYYLLSKDERALNLALHLADFLVEYHLARRPAESGPRLGISNVHGALFAAAGVAETVRFSGKKRHLEWARGLYEHTRDHLSSEYGWVAEHEEMRPPRYGPGVQMATEGCAIVDMVNLAVRLAEQGYPDCWDLVERFSRNYLAEGQLLNTTRLRRDAPRSYSNCSTDQGMPERVRGAFVGWGGPADFLHLKARHGPMVQNCCGSHYPFGLYVLWQRIITEAPDGIHVNLGFTHESSACEVRSWSPFQGKITARLTKPGDLFLRLPYWIERARTVVEIEGRPVTARWRGNVLHFPRLEASRTVRVQYPLRSEVRTERFAGYETEAEWRGDTVLHVSPEGKLVPLFDRREWVKRLGEK